MLPPGRRERGVVGAELELVTYEGFAPHKVPVIVECLTDNRNRTLSNVKLALSKNGGRFAESGSVAWMFEQKGVVRGSGSVPNNDELELALIDVGAEDIDDDNGNTMTVTTGRGTWPGR